MSVSRLLYSVDDSQLPNATQKELKAFMTDFNRVMKEHSLEGQEIMRE